MNYFQSKSKLATEKNSPVRNAGERLSHRSRISFFGAGQTPRFIFLTSIVLIAALCRLLPHPPNFTPIAAMALFGGAYFNSKKFAFIIPLSAMFLSDLVIGLHSTMLAVYASFAIIVLIGFLLKTRKTIIPVFTAAIASSVLFFLITNFAMWFGTALYPQNLGGLVECYIAAIPFFRYTILGDLFYISVLFGGFYLVQLRFPVLAKT